MSITTRLIFSLFVILLSSSVILLSSFQKEKDKCLIIKLIDANDYYQISNIDDNSSWHHIILNYPNVSKKSEKDKLNISANDIKKRKEIDAVSKTGVVMNPTTISYNLLNRQEIKSLPDNIDSCNCASLKKYNLGMAFKLYIERENGWLVFDAKNLVVQE